MFSGFQVKFIALLCSSLVLFNPVFGVEGRETSNCSERAVVEVESLGRQELVNTLSDLDDLSGRYAGSDIDASKARDLVRNRSGVLGGFQSHLLENGKNVDKKMLYGRVGNEYVVAGIIQINRQKKLASTYTVSDNGKIVGPLELTSHQNGKFSYFNKKVAQYAKSAHNPCYAGQTPRCTYSWDCVRKVAPGWAITSCGFLPSGALKAGCVATVAAGYIGKCCKVICQSDFD
ncbi:hypothetical protein [Arcanobacterium phocae]|uniref:hypothetical protein n=1 Tax=Arcanobacterium phocae TaxID=131112 RepID=UPI001C0E985D|nr:hypothetical protein [Arcanobacterium phocae]